MKYIFALLCVSSALFAQIDEQQIREARKLSNQAIAKHDSLGVAEFWTQDFHTITSRNFEMSGKEQTRHWLAKEFQSKKDVVYVRTPIKIEVNAQWNMASESGTWTGQWTEPDGLVKLSGTYYAKWHKINGKWKTRVEVFTPLSCSGSKLCEHQPKLD